MNKFTFGLKIGVFLMLCLVFYAFFTPDPLDEQSVYIQKKLTDHYDAQQHDNGVKQYELKITNSGFCRYKRYFYKGKTEYFSFNLAKFKTLDYLGTVSSGKLYLRTLSDDVIVQTYNDKSGDVDSMASCLIIPLKNLEPEDLNDFNDMFQKMNALLRAHK
jgi:hypothetical protein